MGFHLSAKTFAAPCKKPFPYVPYASICHTELLDVEVMRTGFVFESVQRLGVTLVGSLC